jgi:tetratricopeptide (TPR) repeat protein
MNTGNNTLSLAFDALAAGDYQHAFTLCNEAIDQGISEDWKVGRAEALNMRGTFRFLLGDSQGAKEDFEKSLDLVPDYVQSLVKVASVHMELGDAAGAFGDFETAIRHNPDDPDIYYHRGQREFFWSFPRERRCLPADVPGVCSPPQQSTLSPTNSKRHRPTMKSRRAWTTSLSFPTYSTPSLSTR